MLPFLLVIALVNSCIELEISAPSFLDIQASLGVSEAIVGLTITYNLLAFCLASLIYGPLSDAYGRRRVMIIGNAILTIGAVGCVFAASIEWLLAFRFIQGFGAATSAVVVSAIIADVYPVEKAARLYGFMNAIFTTLMAASPILGGFINAAVGWRGNYAAVAVICLIAWLLLFFFLPETKENREKINLTKISNDYKTLLSSRGFLSDATVPSLLYGCYLAFVAIAPFLYMKTFALDILTYTLHQGVIVAVYAITSALSGKITTKLGVSKTINVALLMCVGGSVFMIFSTTPFLLTSSMSMFCVGSALLYPIIFARSIKIFPDLKGTSSSAIMSLRYLLCSGLVGIASFVYDGTIFTLAIVLFGVNLGIGFLLFLRIK